MRLFNSFRRGKRVRAGILLYVLTVILILKRYELPIGQFVTGEQEKSQVGNDRDVVEMSNTSSTKEEPKGTTVKMPKMFNFSVTAIKFVAPASENAYFKRWSGKLTVGCKGLFNGFSNVMMRLQNVIVDKTFSKVQTVGGNTIESIMNQKDSAETYKLQKGFFQLPCNEAVPSFKFDSNSAHLNDWFASLNFISKDKFENLVTIQNKTQMVENGFTVALMRYEFANVYWTVMDLYNLYLTARFFNKTLSETKVLLIDERPKNHLDDLYKVIFNAKQLHSFPNKTIFTDLVWMFARKHGPILQKQLSIPLVQEFRKDALATFGIPSNHTRNCTALNILLIWRRNYVAHPRNPSGLVWRKIKNEIELLNRTKKAYPSANVRGIQLDLLPLKDQLRYISSADLFVGMHGAAFGFSLFLPPGSGVIEMFPQYVKSNWHMEYLAKWARVHYKSWKNKDNKLEDTKNRYTTVPPQTLTDLMKSLKNIMCPK